MYMYRYCTVATNAGCALKSIAAAAGGDMRSPPVARAVEAAAGEKVKMASWADSAGDDAGTPADKDNTAGETIGDGGKVRTCPPGAEG